jgi:hypothetical protein
MRSCVTYSAMAVVASVTDDCSKHRHGARPSGRALVLQVLRTARTIGVPIRDLTPATRALVWLPTSHSSKIYAFARARSSAVVRCLPVGGIPSVPSREARRSDSHRTWGVATPPQGRPASAGSTAQTLPSVTCSAGFRGCQIRCRRDLERLRNSTRKLRRVPFNPRLRIGQITE